MSILGTGNSGRKRWSEYSGSGATTNGVCDKMRNVLSRARCPEEQFEVSLRNAIGPAEAPEDEAHQAASKKDLAVLRLVLEPRGLSHEE